MRKIFIKGILIISMIMLFIPIKTTVYAQSDISVPTLDLKLENSDDPKEVSTSIQLLVMLTVITLVPSFLIMMTSFTRIIIALHFTRSALGTQQMPPNQVLLGLALFLTLFIMGPIFSEINTSAIKPYSEGAISQQEALENGMKPLRKFMFNQVEDGDVALFLELSGETYESKDAIPNRVLIPAFILGELTKGFKFGVIIYIPFIVIDMVVASILMAMGMMMLPPAMISLPFKVLIFVLAGGFNIVIENLIKTFRMV